MATSGTYTVSSSSTHTEARARAVMSKVLDDFMSISNTGLIAAGTMRTWHEDLSFAVQHGAAARFQIKFTLPSGKCIALEYKISDDGTLHQDRMSGGVDCGSFPEGTKVSVVLGYREGSPSVAKVQAHLRQRGWTSNGTFIAGEVQPDRAYSKEGFGVERTQIGGWP